MKVNLASVTGTERMVTYNTVPLANLELASKNIVFFTGSSVDPPVWTDSSAQKIVFVIKTNQLEETFT